MSTIFPPTRLHWPKSAPGDPPLAERFELYLGQTELANGYQELTDAREQRQRFESDNRQRQERGQTACEIDQHLIMALEHGLPECAGVALGVDRLLMAISGVDSIAEVTAFPFFTRLIAVSGAIRTRTSRPPSLRFDAEILPS